MILHYHYEWFKTRRPVPTHQVSEDQQIGRVSVEIGYVGDVLWYSAA